jgi:hypothetical protein
MSTNPPVIPRLHQRTNAYPQQPTEDGQERLEATEEPRDEQHMARTNRREGQPPRCRHGGRVHRETEREEDDRAEAHAAPRPSSAASR